MREFVTDVTDPRLADYARLTDMELRTSLESAQGLCIAEGTKVISRAVAAGYPVRSVLVAERRLGDIPALLPRWPGPAPPCTWSRTRPLSGSPGTASTGACWPRCTASRSRRSLRWPWPPAG